jgi:hypothetical protein
LHRTDLKISLVIQTHATSNRDDDTLRATDHVFSLTENPLDDSLWSEIFSTPISIRRLSGISKQELSPFFERVQHPGYTTFQTSQAICPDDKVKLGNQYVDTQNFGTAQQTLYIKWGTFKSGLHFFTGSITEAGSYYITGASGDLDQAAPSILNFEFYAVADKYSEILALGKGAANLRTEFAMRGVPGAQSFLARFKSSHSSALGSLSYHPQLKLRIPEIEERDELSSEDAPPAASPTSPSSPVLLFSPSVQRLIGQLHDLSREAFFSATIYLENVYGADPESIPPDNWSPNYILEPGVLASTTPEIFTRKAQVRFSTPDQPWSSMAIFLRVPTSSSRNSDDLKDAKLLLAGPANRFGLREIYSVNNSPDIISNESLMLELFEAFHTVNIGAHPYDPTKLSSLLELASRARIKCSPASLLARIARRDKKT